MSILITSGNSRFAQILTDALLSEIAIRLFDTQFSMPVPDGVEIFTGDLREPDDMAKALIDVDTIIHLTPLVLAYDQFDDVTALDVVTRGSYVLMNAARQAGVKRVILASSLSLFNRLPAHWRVEERWRPRPEPSLDQLCPWLAELSVRESTRVGAMQVICLRFGQLVDDNTVSNQRYSPLLLHEKDAIQGIQQALAYQIDRYPDWSIFHITAPGEKAKIQLADQNSYQESFGYQPRHDFVQYEPSPSVPTQRDERPWREILAPVQTIPSRSIRKAVIFGAGGPMGAITTQELLSSYTLRITDIRPIAEIAAEAKPQAPGAPLPVPLEAPHENQVVDIRNPKQVFAACEGVDAILNCSVMRPHPVDAFLVNTIGAYNVMQAAVTHGIRRIVHTGPLVQDVPGGSPEYAWDYDLHVDAPARPLDHLYIHSKYLGQEICRVFAEYYDLEVPVLLFTSLVNPQTAQHTHPFQISWEDTGRALRRALEVSSLPSPYEMVNISADLPHGRFNHDKARQLLNWVPRDNLAHLWQDMV